VADDDKIWGTVHHGRDKLASVNAIIDGHNLIAKIKGLSLGMPDDEERLIELLNQSATRPGMLEVYFDGAPAGQAGVRTFGRVRAHFVPASTSADEAIRARLRKLGKSAPNWVVVTSDQSVQAAAREAHARIMKSEEYANLLQVSLRGRALSAESKPGQTLSQAEVEEWLAIFKAGKKPKSPPLS
jgi:predicted RNA-binding protein with PIN domain